MARFADCVAVITGAGSGIGKAAAARIANEGGKVILVGRTRSKLEEAAREINRHLKIPAAEVFPADVTDEDDLIELADYIEVQYGDFHILINNAGVSSKGRILELDAKDWDYVQSVNLKSVFLTAKVLGGLMAKGAARTRGNDNRSIVNVASLSGHQAGALIPHYSSAKAGVINLTRSLALEFAEYGIRVNSVSPGFIETPLTEKGLQNDKFVKAIERNTALKRVGTADEIANIIAFIASSEASYMTGSDILADGGWLIK